MRTLIWTLGLLAIGLGTALAVAPSPTGAVVGTSAELTTFWSLILVVGGVLGIALSGLEERVQPATPPARMYLSAQARERLKTERHVRERKKWYLRQIALLHQASSGVGDRPQERIGEFSVGPRQHVAERIIWHRDGKDIYVDDVRYHVTDTAYDENWNHRAANGQIRIADYDGFEDITDRI